MRHVWFQDKNLYEKKKQFDQFLIFRYLIKKISACGFLQYCSVLAKLTRFSLFLQHEKAYSDDF